MTGTVHSSTLARFRPIFLLALAVGVATTGWADVALNIIPTFDASILADPNSAAIQGTINNAINYYETTFTTHTLLPINVTIKFQEGGGLGGSSTTLYKISYQDFINGLTAASSGNTTDTTALAHLPNGGTNPITGSANINVKTAELRALNIPGGPFPPIGGFDGTITLNTALTTPGSPGSTLQYSLFAVTEHEIDEVLGLGSDLGSSDPFFDDPAPEDLYRYDSGGARSYTAAAGFDDAWFSIDGTNRLVQFNQANATGAGGDYGDWWSNNGGGNPGPNPPTRVQDAFASPGTSPTLATDAGTPEIIALDAIGYNLSGQGAVPEPSLIWLMVAGAGLVIGIAKVRARISARSSQES